MSSSASIFGAPVQVDETSRVASLFAPSTQPERSGKRKSAEPPNAAPRSRKAEDLSKAEQRAVKQPAKAARPAKAAKAAKVAKATATDSSSSDEDGGEREGLGGRKVRMRRGGAAEDVEISRTLASAEEAEEEEAPASKGSKAARRVSSRGVARVSEGDSAETEAERLARTIFVGNVPVSVGRKELKKHFATYGDVESIRLRSAAASNLKMPQRAAVITGALDTDVRDATNAYVVFRANRAAAGSGRRSGEAAAAAAVKSDGEVTFGRHLRVDHATGAGSGSGSGTSADGRRSVFVGNLPFDVQEERLWDVFGACGEVSSVRLIREPRTQQGKGFGYVKFVEEGCAHALARARSLARIACAASETEECPLPPPQVSGACAVAAWHEDP